MSFDQSTTPPRRSTYFDRLSITLLYSGGSWRNFFAAFYRAL